MITSPLAESPGPVRPESSTQQHYNTTPKSGPGIRKFAVMIAVSRKEKSGPSSAIGLSDDDLVAIGRALVTWPWSLSMSSNAPSFGT